MREITIQVEDEIYDVLENEIDGANTSDVILNMYLNFGLQVAGRFPYKESNPIKRINWASESVVLVMTEVRHIFNQSSPIIGKDMTAINTLINGMKRGIVETLDTMCKLLKEQQEKLPSDV